MQNIFITLLLFVCLQIHGQVDYKLDVLGSEFKQTTFIQPDDYEGEVICTLVRKESPVESTKAVLYVHGFSDYFFQEEMADIYIAQGYDFYAIDLRKYGRSYLPHQKINNVRDIKEYYDDIDVALRQIKAEGHRFVLLSGHSTGGLTVSVYAHDHVNSDLFSAVFVNSPFYDFNDRLFNRKVGVPMVSGLGKKNPDKTIGGGFSNLYGKSLHITQKGVWDYNLLYKPLNAPVVNYGFVRAIHRAQKKVHKGLQIDVPVLVMHSDKSLRLKEWSEEVFKADVVLNVKHIHKNASKIKGNVTTMVIKDGMHDLVLSKPKVRQQVYKNLFQWLNELER